MSKKNNTSRAHFERSQPEPLDWLRTHKPTGHKSYCVRSVAVHRCYLANPKLAPFEVLAIILRGEFETSLAHYVRVKNLKGESLAIN